MRRFIAVLYIFSLSIILISGCAVSDEIVDPVTTYEDTEADMEAETDLGEPEEVALPAYEVIEVKDVEWIPAALPKEVDHSVRAFIWEIVINEPATVEQLELLSSVILEEAMIGELFNVISINYYDDPDDVGMLPALGSATFGPGGEWERANEVETGQYDQMSFGFTLQQKD